MVVRKGLFFAIGKTKISQCLSGALIKIGLGFLGLKPIGLLLGSIVSQASGITTLAFAAIKRMASFLQIKDLKRVAYRYRRLPMFSSWYGF